MLFLLVFVPVTLFLYQTILFSIALIITLAQFSIDYWWVLLWTFIEYTGHRYVFHSNPKSETEKKLLYLIHGTHMIIQMTQEDWLFRPLYQLVVYCFIGGYTAYLDHTCLRHFSCHSVFLFSL